MLFPLGKSEATGTFIPHPAGTRPVFSGEVIERFAKQAAFVQAAFVREPLRANCGGSAFQAGEHMRSARACPGEKAV